MPEAHVFLRYYSKKAMEIYKHVISKELKNINKSLAYFNRQKGKE